MDLPSSDATQWPARPKGHGIVPSLIKWSSTTVSSVAESPRIGRFCLELGAIVLGNTRGVCDSGLHQRVEELLHDRLLLVNTKEIELFLLLFRLRKRALRRTKKIALMRKGTAAIMCSVRVRSPLLRQHSSTPESGKYVFSQWMLFVSLIILARLLVVLC